MKEMTDCKNNGNKRTLQQKNLLVIDDYSAIIKFLASVLAKDGVVEGAANGRVALEKIMEKHYSVIITDVSMPVMGGFEFFRRASLIYPNIKDRIIFYTSSDDMHSVSYFERNNLPFLIKPASICEIRKSVGSILNRSGNAN